MIGLLVLELLYIYIMRLIPREVLDSESSNSEASG